MRSEIQRFPVQTVKHSYVHFFCMLLTMSPLFNVHKDHRRSETEEAEAGNG